MVATPADKNIALQRADGELRVSLKRRCEATVLDDLYQRGCAKARFPRVDRDAPFEAVLINTAGGLTDGDRVSVDLSWGEGARALITTQAAERSYRSRGGHARLHQRLQVAPQASAIWLPQESIVFDGGRFERRTEVVLAEGAAWLGGEVLVLGRTAMGERVATGAVRDHWRNRSGGKLNYADGRDSDSERHGNLQSYLDHAAIAGGAHVLATVLLVAPDAERYLSPVRDALESSGVASGASYVGATMVMRLAANDAPAIRRTMIALFNVIKSVGGAQNPFAGFSMPRVYDC